MAYADLTAEQKASFDACVKITCELAGEFARQLERLQAVVPYYVGNVETLIAEWQASDVVPNPTDYSGAQDMTKEQFVNLVGYMITASATADGSSGSYNTNYHRSLYAQAAGPFNLLPR